MGFTEYEPGASFPGVIGRTADESEPAWPRPCGRSRGRPTSVHRAGRHRLRPARLLRQPHRDAEPGPRWPPTGCATTTCTPRRCARRAGRASSPGATTTPTPWRASPRWPPATRATTATSRSRTASCPRCCSQHGYNTYMVGKWHLTPASQETAAGPYDRWPLGRGFERYYGFLGGDTSQWYPELVYDNHQVEPPEDAGGGLPPHRGPGRQGDRVHRRRQAGRPGQALLPVLLPRRHARARTTCPKEWADRYAGAFDDGWEAYREQVFARQKELGVVPQTPSCRGTTPTCPSGTRSAPTSAGCTPG